MATNTGNVGVGPQVAYLMAYEPPKPPEYKWDPRTEAYLMQWIDEEKRKMSLHIVSLCTGESWTSDVLQTAGYRLEINVIAGRYVQIGFLIDTIHGPCCGGGAPPPIKLSEYEVPDFIINGQHKLVLVRDDFDVMASVNQYTPPLYMGAFIGQHHYISAYIMFELIDATTRDVVAYMSCYSDALVKRVSFDGEVFTVDYMDRDEMKVQHVAPHYNTHRWQNAKRMQFYFDKPFYDIVGKRPLFRMILD